MNKPPLIVLHFFFVNKKFVTSLGTLEPIKIVQKSADFQVLEL